MVSVYENHIIFGLCRQVKFGFLLNCCRILEQREPGRDESEYHKQQPDDTDGEKSKLRILALQPTFLEGPPLKKENQSSGEIKDCDIDPVRGFSKGAVVGVKQHWDQRKTQQNLSQLDKPEILLFLEKQPLDQREEKQGPVEQLHMLPCRFVDSGKWGNPNVFPCPIV